MSLRYIIKNCFQLSLRLLLEFLFVQVRVILSSLLSWIRKSAVLSQGIKLCSYSEFWAHTGQEADGRECDEPVRASIYIRSFIKFHTHALPLNGWKGLLYATGSQKHIKLQRTINLKGGMQNSFQLVSIMLGLKWTSMNIYFLVEETETQTSNKTSGN